MESKTIATVAVFTALSVALVLSPAKFPAPYAPFLKYQIWEIPIVAAFLLYGPRVGVATSIINTIILLVVYPGDLPIGPLYNLAAVLSMLLGIYIIHRFAVERFTRAQKEEEYGQSWQLDPYFLFLGILISVLGFIFSSLTLRLVFSADKAYNISALFTLSFYLMGGGAIVYGLRARRRQETILTAFSTVLGSITRVGVMTIVNWAFLRYPYPVGFSMPVGALVAMLPIIGLFNATVVLYTIPLGYLVSRAVSSGTNTARWSQR